MNYPQSISRQFYLFIIFMIVCSVLPAAAAAQGKIAFARNTNNNRNMEIFLRYSNQSNAVNLTNNALGDWAPSLSYDGRKIAFVSDRDGNNALPELYVMNADGSNQTRITFNAFNDYSPSINGNGTKIAFTSNRNGTTGIYVVNVDGTNEIPLTTNSAYQPSFSQDGTKITFMSSRDGVEEIYVMNADGSNITRVTQNSASERDPIFSPDNSKIAFVSNPSGQLYVMNANGSNPMRLTNGVAFEPSFSPDGSRIAFSTNRTSPFSVYVVNIDATNEVLLESNGEDPSWSNFSGAEPPVLSNLGFANTSGMNEGGTATLSGNMFSPNPNLAFSLTVNWGDNSTPQVFNYSSGTAFFSETHQYLDDLGIA
ncbi:MAG TPA: DPP IV N-terminal domain-containing protein, partial [Pyrinomonadaceae bacterium]|nr:DPP IV N-terminal domain-containing protein [Pyrinomonadaceae bacterium]